MEKNKKKKGRFVLGILIAGVMAGIVFWFICKDKTGTDAITRAAAARLTALVLADKTEIEATEPTNFSSEDSDGWYVPYAEYLYGKGIWDKERILANKESMGGALTGQNLLDMAGWMQPETPFVLSEGRTEHEPVSREDWDRFYELFLEKYNTEGAVSEIEIKLVGTPNDLEQAGAWEAYTDKGIFSFRGIALDSMVDRLLKVRVRGSELLEVEEILSEEITYENVWLDTYQSGEVRAYIHGVWKRLQVGNVSEDCTQSVADIHMKKGKTVSIELKKEMIKGKLLAVGEDVLEVEGYGTVPLSESFHVYRTYGEFAELSKEELVVGYEQAEYVVAYGKICAAIIGQSVSAERIRVLLTDASVNSIFHETAVFTANEAFVIASQDGEFSERHEAGEQVQIDRNSALFSRGRIMVVPENNGKIGFTSFQRKYGNPWYEGSIELALSEEGILIINEVDLETYLCYVVPSEMPESYGLEALKAQAVCARSYACRQIEGSAYSAYGAHVDDSTTFQVYNNTETDDLTRQAVEETYGQVLTYGGNLVTAYYYATSCGFGNDMQVWGSSQESYPYLKSIHMAGGEEPDLSSEEIFRSYLEQGEEGNLESDAPWYRWETTITTEKMKERMERFLKGYAKSHGDLVFLRQADGSFLSMEKGKNTETIGDIISMQIQARSKSGFASALLIEGTEGAVRVERPGTIRALLGDTEHVYTRKNSTESTGKNILPSASIVLDEIKEGEQLTGWKIRGGGYGHGVGMSQTAASTLAKQGKTYGEILKYFYPGTEVSEEY